MASHATGDGNIPSRDAKKKGLTRIMTVGGVYGTRNYTVKDLRDQKGKKVMVETVPFSIEEASAAEEAGIDTLQEINFINSLSNPFPVPSFWIEVNNISPAPLSSTSLAQSTGSFPKHSLPLTANT